MPSSMLAVVGYAAGIDLGTTWTAAAVAHEGGEPQMVALGGRSASVPTVVAVAPEGWFAVGEAAERRGLADPSRASREFKRRVGDTVPVLLGGAPYSPESLLATVARWALDHVARQEGGAPSSVVVTHPANWGVLRRELLEQALERSGVRARLVTEPEAAAIHYASAQRIPEDAVIAVYDLGGGTFDATVLRKDPAGFEVLGRPSGVERLGGLDFDAAVLGHVTSAIGAAWDALDPDDPATRTAVARLREDCVRAKEALSEDPDAVVPVHLPGVATEVRITRAELEQMVRPSIEQSADVLAAAIAGAGLVPEQVDRILLVGGSSRMPVVAEVLAARFRRPLAVDAHPKHAVALGAARVAAQATEPSPPAAAVAPGSLPPATGVAVTAAGVAPAPASVGAVAPGALPPADGGIAAPTRPRWRAPLGGLAAVLAVVAVVAVVLLTRGGPEDRDELGAGDGPSTTTGPDETTTSTVGDRPPALAADRLVVRGTTSLALSLAACTGADEGCAPGSEVFLAPIEVTCVSGTGCAMSFDGSEPIPLGDDEDVVAGDGAARPGAGLTCPGFDEPDPTTISFILDVPADPEVELGGVVTFRASGNCGERARSYEATDVDTGS